MTSIKYIAIIKINEGIITGRGKSDTCENCTHYDERRGICLLDRTEVEESDWCKHHENEDEE